MEEENFFVGFILGCIVAVAIGFAAHNMTDTAWKEEAIQNHKAHYEVNEHGTVNFVWNDCTSAAK